MHKSHFLVVDVEGTLFSCRLPLSTIDRPNGHRFVFMLLFFFFLHTHVTEIAGECITATALLKS